MGRPVPTGGSEIRSRVSVRGHPAAHHESDPDKAITQVLAVVPVADVAIAAEWYTRLFRRPFTNHPMDTLIEWQVNPSGWVQVHLDPERAGTALVNFAVDELDRRLAELAERGIETSPAETASQGVRLSGVRDPVGNQITFIGNFREVY